MMDRSLLFASVFVALASLTACSQTGSSEHSETNEGHQQAYSSQCYTGTGTALSPSIDTLTAAKSWLLFSEGRLAGRNPAHTIAKHVGRTDEQLRQRFIDENVTRSSTFTDLETAEAVVDSVIVTNIDRIKAWASDPSGARQYEALIGTCTGICGKTLFLGNPEPAYQTEATVYLIRNCLSDGAGFFVNTSYPGR